MRFFSRRIMDNQIQKSQQIEERQSYWRSELLQWAQSGLTQKQFCQERGLSRDMFAWWKARLRDELNLPYKPVKASSTKKKNQQFVQVKVSSRIPQMAYEVVLANNRCIGVGDRFDCQTLKKLIAVLELIC